MSRRLRRILTRVFLVLLVLLVLVVVAFSVMFFWPLEGSVGEVVSLVPADVDFVYRTTWPGLQKTRWIQANVLEDPVVPEVAELKEPIESAIRLLRQNEDQINARIPIPGMRFSFEDDVFPDEIVAAGRWCEGSGPERGPPRWRELLFLTRISWKSKFFSALRHGFVRDRMGPDLKVEDLDGGIFRFTMRNVRISSVRERSGCGPGIVIPPENVWYGMRVKDVLAFSNTEGLLRKVGELAEYPDSGRAYVDRPHVQLPLREDGVSASMDVQGLELYLVRLFEQAGLPGAFLPDYARILQRYITVTALDRLSGALTLPSRDLVRTRADIRFLPSQLEPGVRDVYELRPESTRGGIASLVPGEDTFGALLVRTPPRHLLLGIYNDLLQPGDRQLWSDNLKKMQIGRDGPIYENVDQFLKEFATKLGETAAVAVGRISETFDDLDYPHFFADPQLYPDPEFPALAMMVQLRRDTSAEELDAYLAERVPMLGGSRDLERVEYRGLTYTRVKLEFEAADFVLFQPAYILAQDHFIFASNESYFRKILDTIVDPRGSPPLADMTTYRSTMDKLPAEVHVLAYLDLDNLFRVPPDAEAGSQPRGFLWDRRNLWINENRKVRNAADEYRKELIREITSRTGRGPANQQLWEIEEKVDAFAEQHRENYPKFLEEYREELSSYGRLRSIGLGIVARGSDLGADAALLLKSARVAPAEEE